jgi:ABC-type glycerol-3-phosphate transport system substrate-binding protein
MKRLATLLVVVVVLASFVSACAPPTPEVIEKEVVVEKEVPVTVEVEKEVVVEKVITPTPPPPGPTEMTVLIRMMDMQDKWFREELVPAFEKEYNCKLNVVTFDKFPDIEVMVKLEVDTGRKTIGFVKTPQDEVYPMVALGYMMPLEDIVGKEEVEKIKDEYVESAWNFGVIEGKTYYIPRKLETYLFFYLKSKVAEAVANWETFKDDINAMFKDYNGYGLPAGYEFEADPSEWDYYDLAVFAYYWAHTPGEDGLTKPRLCHRGKDYGGTSAELYTKIFEMGGTAEDIAAMDTDPVIDMYEWEAFFIHNNLYDSGMWEESWSGGGIWKALAAGRVYAANHMHQIDSFFIRGGTHPDMAGYLADPEDMGLALVPKGVSLELDADGKPVREGGHYSNFAGWWWGVPVTSPDPKLSYELARFITSAEWHKKESSIFGMMPVRKDIYADLAAAFPEKWMQEVFDISLKQFEAGTEPPLLVPTLASISQLYRNAWYDICTGKNYAPDPTKGPDRDYIAGVLSADYAPTVKKLAGK